MTTIINGSSPSVTFSDGTTQTTAGLPLTGGTLSGAVTVTGGVTANNFVPTSSTVPTNGMFLSAANTISFATGGVATSAIDSTGNFYLNYSGATQTSAPQGMSISGPASTLLQYYMIKATQVEAHIGFKSGSDSNLYVGTAGGITGIGTYGTYQTNTGTSWSAVSDETTKTDLVEIQNGAEKVATLRAVTGRYKTDPEGKSRSFLIAQDVQKVLPEAISIANPEEGILGLGYTDVIPLLVAAIKELKAEIDIIKAK